MAHDDSANSPEQPCQATSMSGVDYELPDRVWQLLDEHGDLLEEGLLPITVYNDEDVFEAELRRIFGRCWVFVGHETEIPEPGDYARRYVGRDICIFVRDENREVRVRFDSCTHLGSALCRAEQGNTSHFRCPYHGWTFKNTGELTGWPRSDTGWNCGRDATTRGRICSRTSGPRAATAWS